MNEQALIERLESLERAHRRTKKLALVLVCGFAAVLLQGQGAGPKPLETDRLSIKDKDGHLRAELSVNKTGMGSLVIYDKEGKGRAFLGVDEKGLPTLGLCDRNEKPRLALSMSSDDACGVTIQNAAGKARASLLTDVNGAASIAIFDEGSPRFTLALGKNGLPLLSLADSDKRQRLILGLGDKGVPLLTMSDEKARPRAVCVVGPDGSPAFILEDDAGRSRVIFAVSGDTAGVNVSDAQGKPHLNVEVKNDGATTYQVIDREGQKVFSTP